VTVGFRGIPGAAVEFNQYFICDRHGEVTPIEPEVPEPDSGRWADGYDSFELWRQRAPEPTRRTRPPPMGPAYAIGAVRATKAPRPRFDTPLDPRSFG
jgi:hypothetical protein